MSNEGKSSLQDIEAENELFGEMIDTSDAEIDSVNVMERSDLSESSSARGSSIHLPKRRSEHAGIGDEDRAGVKLAAEPSSNTGLWMVLALVVLVGGGLWLLTSGANDPKTAEQPTVVAPKPPVVAEADDGRGDGTPTLDVETLSRGMVAAGWRVGDPSVTTIDEVTQTNLLATKGESAAAVTIYESKTWDWANQVLLETEAPARPVSFGRTIVRISPGPPERGNGVVDLFDALSEFKKAARAKADVQE